jgi:hypothetical protein
MGNHIKRQIRERAVQTLTGLATTGVRVFASRARMVQPADLPCLRVFCSDEKIRASVDGA